jgi:hypothetical protein
VNIFGRKIHLERERLDRDGYTQMGRYFGVGLPLFRVTDDETGRDLYIRARDRAAAARAVKLEDKANPSYSEIRYFWSKVNAARPNPRVMTQLDHKKAAVVALDQVMRLAPDWDAVTDPYGYTLTGDAKKALRAYWYHVKEYDRIMDNPIRSIEWTYDRPMERWIGWDHESNRSFQIYPPSTNSPVFSLYYWSRRIGFFSSLEEAKKAAEQHGIPNPLSSTSFLLGVAALGAVGAAIWAFSQNKSQSQGSTADAPTVVLASPGSTKTISNVMGATVELPAGSLWVSATGFDITSLVGTNSPLVIVAGTSTVLTWTDASGAKQQMTLNVNAS